MRHVELSALPPWPPGSYSNLVCEVDDEVLDTKKFEASSNDLSERERCWCQRHASFFFILLVLLAAILFLGSHAEFLTIAPTNAEVWEQLATRFDSNMSSREILQGWEDFPLVKEAINDTSRAVNDLNFRRLQDLFYTEGSEAYPYIRTECVIDTVQATAYLIQAVVFLYRAIEQPWFQCPKSFMNLRGEGCAAAITSFIASVTWVGSYLSLAGSSCSAALNSGALCSADWLAMSSDFAEVAASGAAVRRDCTHIPKDKPKGWWGRKKQRKIAMGKVKLNASHPWLPLFNQQRQQEHYKLLKVFDAENEKELPGGLQLKLKLDRLHRARQIRKFDIAACHADVFNAASYLVRSLMQIRAAAMSCSDPRSCAVDIMNVIASVAWISRFVLLASSDCAPETVKSAKSTTCGADISNLIAALSSGPAAGMAVPSDCTKTPDPIQELMHEPGD